MAKNESQGKRNELRRMGSVIDDLFANDNFISAAVEGHNNAQSRAELKANPRAFLQGKGPDIPSELELEFLDETPPRLRLIMKGNGVSTSAELRSGDKRPSTDPKAVAEFRRMGREAHRVMASDAMLDVVEEAIADAELQKQFKADPRAYLGGKGIRIPDNVNFEVAEKSNPWLCWCWDVCSGCCCVRVCACVEI